MKNINGNFFLTYWIIYLIWCVFLESKYIFLIMSLLGDIKKSCIIFLLYSYFSEFHSGCIYTSEKILLILSRTRYSLNKLTVQVTKHHPLLQLNVFNFATNHNSSNSYNPVSSLPNSIVGGGNLSLPTPSLLSFLNYITRRVNCI